MRHNYHPIAMREAQAAILEAEANWRAGNHWGAVADLWTVLDRCRRTIKEEGPVLVQAVLVAMLERDAEEVARQCREVRVYLEQPSEWRR